MRKVDNAVILSEEEYAKLKKDADAGRERRAKKRRGLIRSVTVFLFMTSQLAALLWVSASYVIAIYSTFVLGQPFPVETLSGQAVTVLLGVSFAKVLENIFEHNDGVIWGNSKSNTTDTSGPDDTGAVG